MHELGDRAGGFFTPEISKIVEPKTNPVREGFKVVTLDGKEGILAHVNFKSPFKLGRYGIDIKAFEEIGVAALEEAIENKEWIVVDEIAPMEEYSEKFKRIMTLALDSSKRVLAAIRIKDSPFSLPIKSRPDVEMIKLTVPTRKEIFQKIASYSSHKDSVS